MDTRSRSEQLDAEILGGVSDLIGRIVSYGERLAQDLALPTFFIKALHSLDCPMAMKELGRRMHCDPSFVTVIADMLEKRGLATREAHPGDRRIKNLVLTQDGIELQQRVMREFAARMPWSRALSEQEREQLLTLIRKMISVDDSTSSSSPTTSTADGPDAPAFAGEVDGLPKAAPLVLTEP